ncbi:MAG: hypothetical protein WC584_00255 [Candidatus Pacearchaeota archaeon]
MEERTTIQGKLELKIRGEGVCGELELTYMPIENIEGAQNINCTMKTTINARDYLSLAKDVNNIVRGFGCSVGLRNTKYDLQVVGDKKEFEQEDIDYIAELIK